MPAGSRSQSGATAATNAAHHPARRARPSGRPWATTSASPCTTGRRGTAAPGPGPVDGAGPDRRHRGGHATYTFTADRPGTFLYEAAPLPNAQHQTAMGLHGALVVHPATAGRAYASPPRPTTTTSARAQEIDPALNNAADPSASTCGTSPRASPVNGRPTRTRRAIPAAADSTQLLRYVNAGVSYHSMAVLGAGQTLIALDGAPQRRAALRRRDDRPRPDGRCLVQTPAAPTVDIDLSVYDAALGLHNSNTAGVGGMLPRSRWPAPPPGRHRRSGGKRRDRERRDTDRDRRRRQRPRRLDVRPPSTTSTRHRWRQRRCPVPAGLRPGECGITASLPATTSSTCGPGRRRNWGPFTSVLVSGGDAGPRRPPARC